VAITLRLTQADQERLGAPQDVEIELDRMMMKEVMALEEHLGLSHDEFLDALRGQPTAERNKTLVSQRAWGFALWMSLHRIGVDMPFADFDYDVTRTVILAPAVKADEPDPKDPSTHEKPNGDGSPPSGT
jgi:hypothetical protein